MTPAQAGALMKAARHALRREALKARDITLLDCLMFSCRLPGKSQAVVSLLRLAKLTGMCKQSVVDALARLYTAGLLCRYQQRKRHGWASRRDANRYEFLPPRTESTPQSASREQSPLPVRLDLDSPLGRALNRLGGAIENRQTGFTTG